jgi:hypothetical protein
MEPYSRDQAEARRGGVRNILREAKGMVYFQLEIAKIKLQKLKSKLS